MVCTYDCLTGINNILSLLIYGGVWQRPEGILETDNNQHSADWSNGQPDPHIDEHQLNNCLCGMAEFIQLTVVQRVLDRDAQTRPHLWKIGC